MSSLQSAIEDLAAQDLGRVTDASLGDDVVELRRRLSALEAEWLRRVAEFDRRRCHENAGALSTRAWLRASCGLSGSAATRAVHDARGLDSMTLARAALADGSIRRDHVRVLVDAWRAHRDLYERDESILVDAARDLPFRHFRRAVAYWRHAADDTEAARDHDARFRRRGVYLSQTWGGMVRIHGELDPEGGEIVAVALRSITDVGQRSPDDRRTGPQRRADSLVELCRAYLDAGDAATTGVERPHIVVTLDLESLLERSAGRCELEDAGPISPEVARRIACDAGITRVITDGSSAPLDVGRKTRVVPASLRRALIVRDGGCVAPGCDRPHRWCDAHHVIHWADGGPTSLDNLVLLCRRHHRMVHDGRLAIEAFYPRRE